MGITGNIPVDHFYRGRLSLRYKYSAENQRSMSPVMIRCRLSHTSTPEPETALENAKVSSMPFLLTPSSLTVLIALEHTVDKITQGAPEVLAAC
jgi:hypothetical protein